jgi:translocation and assembly module TamB
MVFTANGTDLNVPDIYGIQGKVSGEAEIRQTPETAEVTGTLRFSKAEMNLGRLETDIAQNIQIIETNTRGDLLETKQDAKNPSKFENVLKMDVGLVLPPDGTWITGKGLKAEITGNLKLEKARGGPLRLLGELQAIRGTYTFQGKELRITEGSLVFLGTPSPEPRLKIVCEKQVRDVIVQAKVSGPLDQPKMTLSSIPSMNQVDILSYLFFDHPAGELSSKENSQLGERAAAWLGTETSLALKQALGNNPLAPDTLQYRTSSKLDRGFANNPSGVGSATTESSVIEIGKYITPDLYVTYGRGVKANENQVQVEYRMKRNLSIQTQVGGSDQSGVDIFWRHDFGK